MLTLLSWAFDVTSRWDVLRARMSSRAKSRTSSAPASTSSGRAGALVGLLDEVLRLYLLLNGGDVAVDFADVLRAGRCTFGPVQLAC